MSDSYKLAIFDFDGTLMDTSSGILYAATRTLDDLKAPHIRKENERKFFGPPLPDCYRYSALLDESKIPQAVILHRHYYETEGLKRAELYPGMLEVLKKLNADGIIVAMASLKVEDICVKMLENFRLDGYFKVITGCDRGNNLTKTDIINKTIDRVRNTGVLLDKKDVLMIGDTELDRKGARNAQVDFCAVTYGLGYSCRADVPEADYFADSPEQIFKAVYRQGRN